MATRRGPKGPVKSLDPRKTRGTLERVTGSGVVLSKPPALKEINATRVFGEAYGADPGIRLVVNRGGTRSGKSYALAQLCAFWLCTGRIGSKMEVDQEGVFSIVRKTLPSLKATVLRDLDSILESWGWLEHIVHHKLDKEYRYGRRVIDYFAVDDQQKIRSRARNHLFACEANELNYDEYLQLAMRTTGRIFLDFNPSDPYTWINLKIEQERSSRKGDVLTIISTYQDNRHNLAKWLVEEIEGLRDVDPELWKVYGQGEYGVIKNKIYSNDMELIPEFPRELLESAVYGLDFGYSNPMAMVRVARVDNPRSELHPHVYIEELYYEKHSDLGDLVKAVEGKVPQGAIIYADSASPGQIEMLRQVYSSTLPSYKYNGSLKDGIAKLRRCKWFVVGSSTNLLRERMSYKNRTDREGRVMEESVEKTPDHALDALRYAYTTHYFEAPFMDDIEALWGLKHILLGR